MAVGVMLGLLVVSVLIMGIGLEYQRGWESTPEPLRTWLLQRTYPQPAGPHLFIVNPKQRAQLLQRRAARRLHAATTTKTNRNNVIAITQNDPVPDSNALLLHARADALAALVVAGKVGETEGIKLVFGVSPSSSNRAYLDARAALKAAIAKRQRPTYAPLKDGQQQPITRTA